MEPHPPAAVPCQLSYRASPCLAHPCLIRCPTGASVMRKRRPGAASLPRGCRAPVASVGRGCRANAASLPRRCGVSGALPPRCCSKPPLRRRNCRKYVRATL